MGTLHDAILAACEAELRARDAWDEPPALYFLHLKRGEPVLHQLQAIPDYIWAWDRPAETLTRIADHAQHYARLLTAAAPDNLHGVGFRSEAWQLTTERDASAAERRRNHEDSTEHRIHARPDRVEIRTMSAVDRAGITYMAAQRRDDGEVTSVVLPKRIGESRAQGSVPGALDKLVTAFLGVQLGRRETEVPSWLMPFPRADHDD
jgi:hypothetical protein